MGLKELEAAWNAKADRFNQWHELGLDEIVAFAQEVEREACAQICLAEKDAWAGSEYEMAVKDCARSIRNQGRPRQPHVEIKFTRVCSACK